MSIKAKMMYPNQKMITVCDNGAPAKDTKQPYSVIDNETKFAAMRDLKPTSFMMWEYICSNRKGFDLLLSRVDVMNQTGIGSSSYDSAIKELKEKKYLIPKKEGANTFFCFYARPQEATTIEKPTEDTTRPPASQAVEAPAPAPRTIPAPAPKKIPKIIPFTIRCLTDEEKDYKITGTQPPQPQTKEHKSLSVDDINALLAEEC